MDGKFVICTFVKTEFTGSEIPFCSEQDGCIVDEADVERVGAQMIEGHPELGWVARRL